MKLSKKPHAFPSVRDAIDAMSQFEARVTDAYLYQVARFNDGYAVRVSDDFGLGKFIGWIAP